ncbi:hypothetical protein H0H93_009601 [Arthromyces matolae]|nr:hypothetical protein H0H93_009601 [Arthromyces matolae]
MNRAHTCTYDDKQQKSRTQLLKEQLAQLEQRLQDLESGSSSSSSSSGPHSPPYNTYDLDFGIGHFDDRIVFSYDFSSTSSSPSPTHSEIGSTAPSLLFDPMELKYRSKSVSPSASVLGAPVCSDPIRTLSPPSKQHLLEVFMAHRHQCWFYASMDRFIEAQPGNDPHPALINAMYLIACHFAHSPFYSELEPAFFVQVQHDINTALDTSNRLPDIVQASALLAIYLYLNNRVMEGYRHTFSAIKLAVGLGLHQIQPTAMLGSMYPSTTPLISINPPRDETELQDRVFAFWQIFMIDRCWSVANGLPLALPDKESPQSRILTPWPSFSGSGEWNVNGFEQQPLLAFFEGAEHPLDESIATMKAKAAALYELTSRSKNVNDANDWGYHYAQAALQRFSSTIHPIQFDLDSFVIQVMIYASFINLRCHLPFDEQALKAANSIVQLICHSMSDHDWQYLDPIVSACWLSAAELFIFAIANSKLEIFSGDLTNAVGGYQRNLDVLVQALNKFGAYSPLSSDLALRVELARG